MKKINKKNKIGIAAVGASVNLLLFFIKLYIGLSTNSIAIYADSLNSMTDGAVCIAAAVGFTLMTAKPSEKYPFGFGRIEELLDLLISVVILITGGVFAYISLERVFYPVPVWYSELYAVLIAVTAAVKLVLAVFFKAMSKKHGAKIIKGLGTDSLLDFFITLCTLVSLTVSAKTGFSVDGIAGIFISLLLTAEGVKMTLSAVGAILGRNDAAECEAAEKIIETDPQVQKITGIRCFSFGETKIFTAEIEISCESAEEIAVLSQRLEAAIGGENKKLYLKIRRQ